MLNHNEMVNFDSARRLLHTCDSSVNCFLSRFLSVSRSLYLVLCCGIYMSKIDYWIAPLPVWVQEKG